MELQKLQELVESGRPQPSPLRTEGRYGEDGFPKKAMRKLARKMNLDGVRIVSSKLIDDEGCDIDFIARGAAGTISGVVFIRDFGAGAGMELDDRASSRLVDSDHYAAKAFRAINDLRAEEEDIYILVREMAEKFEVIVGAVEGDNNEVYGKYGPSPYRESTRSDALQSVVESAIRATKSLSEGKSGNITKLSKMMMSMLKQAGADRVFVDDMDFRGDGFCSVGFEAGSDLGDLDGVLSLSIDGEDAGFDVEFDDDELLDYHSQQFARKLDRKRVKTRNLERYITKLGDKFEDVFGNLVED